MSIWSKLLINWDKLMTAFLLGVAFIIILFDVYNSFFDISINTILSLALLILSPIPLALGKVLHHSEELKTTVNDLKAEQEHHTEELKSTVNDLKAELDDPEISKVVKNWDEVKEEMLKKMKNARRIQILTRTGQRIYEHMLSEIPDLYNKDIQLLCINPIQGGDHAFEMYFQQRHESIASRNVEKDRHIRFLNQIGSEHIKINVMNYLSPYTLILIDCPKKGEECSFCNDAVIYVELASFNSPLFGKPVLRVTRSQVRWFEFFWKEFNDMWEREGTIWGITDSEDAQKKSGL